MIQKNRKTQIREPKWFIEHFFKIRTKDKKIIPFLLNEVQSDYVYYKSYIEEPGKGGRDIIHKGRQHGMTTLIIALFLHDTLTHFATNTVIVGHDVDAMEKQLENAKLMFYSIPAEFRPQVKYDNEQELFFPQLNSWFYISTYRKLKLRSQTINNLLLTEVAFWKTRDIDSVIAGMTEAVPIDGNITVESTPNGVGGYFWEMVQNAKKGESIYKYFEYPWFVNKEYEIPQEKWHLLPKKIRPEGDEYKLDKIESSLIDRWGLSICQIIWRRYKMISLGDMRTNEKGVRHSRRFSQEYECNFVQSGQSVFDSTYIIPSTLFQEPKPGKKYLHGGDTAEGIEGGDYNVLYTLDLETGENVNKIRGLWKPKDFAYRIHSIGMKYGGLVGIEANNTGLAVLEELLRLWEEEACRLQSTKAFYSLTNKLPPYRIYSEQKRMGWYTNENKRKIMFIELEEALRHEEIKLAYEDEQGMEELIACQYNERMKEEAPVGMHDDSIIALSIAWQMRKYYQFYFKSNDQSGVRLKIV